jgi:glutathione peroxidase
VSQAIQNVPVRRIDGSETTLGEYDGKVLLVVNVASKCGLTPQYEGLQSLYDQYRDKGLVVLGFPANEFAGQEPGTNEEIADFCDTSYSVKFPLFEKIVVKGEGQHPLYKALTAAQPKAVEKPDSPLRGILESRNLIEGRRDDDILWNFEKFVVGRDGAVKARFAPDIAPDDPALVSAIEGELKA